jgi:hypothetical protein
MRAYEQGTREDGWRSAPLRVHRRRAFVGYVDDYGVERKLPTRAAAALAKLAYSPTPVA